MRIPLLTLTVLFGVVSCLPAAPDGRERIRFDDGWKFHRHDGSTGDDPAPLVTGEKIAGWRWKISAHPETETADVVRGDFDDSAWNEVQDGHGIIKTENTSAWFRAVLPNANGPKPRLHFEGVDDAAVVYLNGKLVAQHTGWEEAFDVALDAVWQPDGKNVLIVLAQNSGSSGGIDPVYFQSGETVQTLTAEKGPAAAPYDDHAWRDVHLPHDFVVEGTFDPKAEASHGFLPPGAGWYRKTFSLPAEDKGKVLWLEFDGVYRNSIVWLNGRQLGKHASGYTSFYYDVSGEANYGGENVLTVWADARRNEGWWYEGGGIYRHVYLTKLAPTHVAHWGTKVVATPNSDFTKATVEVEVEVESKGNAAADLRVVNRILARPDHDATGEVAQKTAQIKIDAWKGNSLERKVLLDFEHPRLWSPEEPNLYTLETTLYQGDAIIDRVRSDFGGAACAGTRTRDFFSMESHSKSRGPVTTKTLRASGLRCPTGFTTTRLRNSKRWAATRSGFRINQWRRNY